MRQFCSGEGVMVLTVRGSGNVEQGVGFEDGQLFGKIEVCWKGCVGMARCKGDRGY